MSSMRSILTEPSASAKPRDANDDANDDAFHDAIHDAMRLVDIADWTRPGVCVLDVDASDRQACLRTAADALARRHALNAGLAYDALWRREQAASTGLGGGFAVPHARVRGIDRPVTAFVRTRVAVPFDAPDRVPVACLLVILVPERGDPQDHLSMLALVARIAADAKFRDRIARASSADEAAAAFDRAIGAAIGAR